jgi:hypothetical protein
VIKLIGNYEIHGQNLDYALVLNEGKTKKQVDKKSGEVTIKPHYKTVGYYRAVEDCVIACYRHATRMLTNEEEMTLKEAAKRFEEIEQRLEAIMPDCFKWRR